MSVSSESTQLAEVKSSLHSAERSASTSVCDPLEMPEWDTLLKAHPDSSFFHGRAWARVLHDTYGHHPLYFCSLAGGQLQELLPVMEVSSPWTGRRGVSLPFTDLCTSLKPGSDAHRTLYDLALEHGRDHRWRYLECRGGDYARLKATPSLSFYGHEIALYPGPESLFKALDGAVRRGIRKAQDSNLRVEFTNTLDAIRSFYSLHCVTRQRHGLPPQPFRFFRNIAHHVLQRGHGFVATARLEKQPVAAAVFLHAGSQAIYKFGASELAFQHLRPNNLLMWEAIKRYAENGFSRLHLGRTSLANEGLRRFKLGFGAREEKIEYHRYDFLKNRYVTDADRAEGWINRVFRQFPQPLLRLAGELLYPHLS